MHTKFFGSFLLNHGVITSDQLLELIKLQATSNMKLGAMAIHAGLMTGREVEDVFVMQEQKNKSFSELVVSEGYLTQAEVDDLRSTHTPDFLVLGQNLVEKNIITSAQLQNLITDYQSEYEIDDFNLMEDQKTSINDLIQHCYLFEDTLPSKIITPYIDLLFTNLTNMIGSDFSLLTMLQLPECPVDIGLSQKISGEINLLTAIEMEPPAAVAFSSRYLKKEKLPAMEEQLLADEELVKECLADFLNLHNGLFSVNMSNDYSIDFNLSPPEIISNSGLFTKKTCYMIPIVFSFGTVHLIFSVL